MILLESMSVDIYFEDECVVWFALVFHITDEQISHVRSQFIG